MPAGGVGSSQGNPVQERLGFLNCSPTLQDARKHLQTNPQLASCHSHYMTAVRSRGFTQMTCDVLQVFPAYASCFGGSHAKLKLMTFDLARLPLAGPAVARALGAAYDL